MRSTTIAAGLLTRFLAREFDVLFVARDGVAQIGMPRDDGVRLLVVPGSFDPLHEGHLALAAAAAAALERRDGAARQVVYELSVANADKGQVDTTAMTTRLAQFAAVGAAVACTRAPLYLDKAALFMPCAFVIGADTASRVLDAKYYDSAAGGLEGALDAIASRGCEFVVGGRRSGDDFVPALEALASLAEDSRHRPLFLALDERDFRLDLSSTEIRKRRVQS